jgi:hypothetical protein
MLVFDLRDAMRGLARDRLYSIVTVLTLALGATTAVVAIIHGVLLKPMAYRESHRLVAVNEVVRVGTAGTLATLTAAGRGLVIDPAAALREE